MPGYIRHLSEQTGKKVDFSVTLVEAAGRVMPRSSKAMSRSVKRRLKNLGVKVMVNAHVQGEDASHLTINGQNIVSSCVVWTAGMAISTFYSENNFEMHNRRVAVNAYLEADDDIYVLGDNADTPYSGMAQTAMHDAKFVGQNLVRKIEDKDPRSYKAQKPICVTPVGPRWAALQYGKVEMYGILPWFLRHAATTRAHIELEPILQAARTITSGVRAGD